jgi:hypothetical protein
VLAELVIQNGLPTSIIHADVQTKLLKLFEIYAYELTRGSYLSQTLEEQKITNKELASKLDD